ncbi:hypothetical protein ACVJGD_004432 [Bradyrhizobium sp. USDA 10063]
MLAKSPSIPFNVRNSPADGFPPAVFRPQLPSPLLDEIGDKATKLSRRATKSSNALRE